MLETPENDERGERLRFPMEEFVLPLGEREWKILHTRFLLTQEEEKEHFASVWNELPYGVVLWPSAIALAHELHARADALRGKTVLELGAGTGLPGMIAASVGASVVQTDLLDMALYVSRLNAERNGITGIRYEKVNWMRFTDTTRYDFIIGSDILYAPEVHGCLREIFSRNLAPGGHILITDPLREDSLEFFQEQAEAGWDIHAFQWAMEAGEETRTVAIFEMQPGENARTEAEA